MSQTYADMTLVGRLTDKPTLHDAGNTKVGHMALAVDRPGKEKETDFFRVTTWGKQAEACHQYLEKGSLLFVKGRPEIQEWERDGQKHKTLDIQANEVRFLERQQSASRDSEPVLTNDGPER